MRFPRLLACTLFLALASTSGAEEGGQFDPHDEPRLFTVRDTSTVRALIEDFRAARKGGRVTYALRLAQDILDRYQEDFYLIDETDERGRTSTPASVLWRAAAEVVRDDLATMSEPERRAYEELARPSASPLIEEALARRDLGRLREVQRRFGASRTGIEAGRILASFALQDGRYQDAAWFAREALRFAPRDPVLWQMRIHALRGAGDHAALARLTLPTPLDAMPNDRPLDVGALLKAARAATPAPASTADWPMWGGSAARTGVFPHEPPLPKSLRWTEYTDFVERDRDTQHAWYRDGEQHPRFRRMLQNFRPTHPVVSGRSVFAGDGRSLRAYDLYSGRTLWRFDATRYPGGRGAPFPMLSPGKRYPGRTNIERAFAPIVTDDFVVGTVEEVTPYYADRLQRIEISTYLPRRRLVAVDKQTGDVRWVFAQRGVDNLAYGHYSIVSAPAVSQGLVLALGSYFDGTHRLVFFAVDATTGKLVWSRELGAGQQELNLFGVPVKELAASPVTVSDGVAYVSTGVGFVAALDVRTGIPRWVSSYEIIEVQEVDYWYRAPLRLPRVACAPPLAHKDVLIVAPTDSNHLYVFDRDTGRLRWRRASVDRTGDQGIGYDVFAHVIGVVNDGKRDVVLTSDSRVVARRLYDDPASPVDDAGELAWASHSVPKILGLGAIAGDEVVIPAKDGLHRFSIRSEGKVVAGVVPWPNDAEPGNILPLERVLLVAGRDNLQWFYDWEDLERDVARRRRENPSDPTILLEAGELYLRAGDETARARAAFTDALRIARRSAPDHVPHAERGLYLAWRREGDLNATSRTKATRAYEESLQYAATPEERVATRMKLHAILEGSAAAQRKNLEQLVDEAETAVFTFEPEVGPVTARVHALLLLADVHRSGDNARRAVDTLQQTIREAGSERYGSGTVREHAHGVIEAILLAEGRSAYAEHERKARALVDRARQSGDSRLLEQVIREYPNAGVLGEALLVRANQALDDDRPDAAIKLLREVLAGHADRPVAASALALLARAYRIDGARGAARLTLERLRSRFAERMVTIGTERLAVPSFVATELATLGDLSAAPPSRPLTPPLAELSFEPGSDESSARALEIATDAGPDGTPIDPALSVMVLGPDCVAFDMTTGGVAWRASPGVAQRGAWIPGAARTGAAAGTAPSGRLVLSVRDQLRGFDDATGTETWTRGVGGYVRELHVRQGVLFALIQENNLAGTTRLMALDGARGRILWTRDLGPDNPRRMRVWEDRVLLERSRFNSRRSQAHLLIFDAIDGRPLHEVVIPTQTEAGRIVTDGALILASREIDRANAVTLRRMMAFDIRTGRQRWRRLIPQRSPVTALAAHGKTALALLSDGHLLTVDAADGSIKHTTRIHVQNGVSVRPFVQSGLLLTDTHVTFLPAPRAATRDRPAQPSLMCFERSTGKLAWERPYLPGTDLNAAKVMRYGDIFTVVISHRRSFTPHVNIRLVSATDGSLLQEIAPDELAQQRWVPSARAGYGTLVVFGKSGASVFRSRSAARPGR